MRVRLEALETHRNHEHIGDTSDEEVPEEEEETNVETIEVKILKSIFGASSSSRENVPFYSGNLNLEELIDWINAMNKHFDFAEVKARQESQICCHKVKRACILGVGWCARGKDIEKQSHDK